MDFCITSITEEYSENCLQYTLLFSIHLPHWATSGKTIGVRKAAVNNAKCRAAKHVWWKEGHLID